MNMLSVVLFGIGTILVYAGIKDVDPREVVKDAIAGKSNPGENSKWTGKWGKLGPGSDPYRIQKGGTIRPERKTGIQPPDEMSGPDVVGV